MTIPLLTIMQSDPAKSPVAASGNRRSEPRRDTDPPQQEERDFAATMSEGAQNTRTESTKPAQSADKHAPADPARQSDAAADGTDRTKEPKSAGDGQNDEIISDIPAQDAPRRRVTIPDLPATRSGDVTAELRSSEAVRGLQTASAAVAAATADKAARATPGLDRASQVASPRSEPARAAATTDPLLGAASTPATSRAEAAPAAGVMVLPESAKASSKPEELASLQAQAAAKTAHDDQRRGTVPPEQRTAAHGIPPVQPPHANSRSMAMAQPPAEDRTPARSRDPLARAVEAVAAPNAPAPQSNAAQALVSAQVAMLQPVARDAAMAKDKTESLLSLDGESEGMRFDLRGTSGSTSTQPGSFASALSQTHLPRGIAMQLGDIVRAMPDRPVEVALSPEELGRVRLSISTSEGGVTLHVLAERPETLELMRRHAEQLARELADLGFGSIDLSFGQGRDPDGSDDETTGGDAKGRTMGSGDDTDAAIPAEGSLNHMTLSPSGGLDIRI